MKFVALLSGGKDSIYAALKAIENGHELACCAHLAPSPSISPDEESYMYQTAGSEAVRLQVEECIGVPLFVGEIRGRSENTSLVYGANGDDCGEGGYEASDEVEDLYRLLRRIKRDRPDVGGVSSGAILSTYQRTRIENVCSRLGLASLSYLWRSSCQRTLLNSILDDGGIDAVLMRVACPPGLTPGRHLGRSLRDLRDGGIFDRLRERYGMHPAGEGGEYETLVLDCPRLFRRGRLVLEETEVILDPCDEGVGVLRVKRCRAERRREAAEGEGDGGCVGGNRENHACWSKATEHVMRAKAALVSGDEDADGASTATTGAGGRVLRFSCLPNVRTMKGGLCHVSALLSPRPCDNNDDEAGAAVQEFLCVRSMLQIILTRLFPKDEPRTSPRDVVYVHLYLSEMSHFALINQHYLEFFGAHLPPSRSCVAVGRGALPGGRRVMMDCLLQRGSGGYLRSSDPANINDERSNTFIENAFLNKQHTLRNTLHVQSISTWAPVCIGPYSQANSLRSALVFLAGMIGLIPQSMALLRPDVDSNISAWEAQLHQSWRNAAAVLDGMEDGGGKLEDCLGGLVYLSLGAFESLLALNGDHKATPWQRLWSTARCICDNAISTNAGVVVGSVDGTATESSSTRLDSSLYDEDGVLFGGYEDKETWREMSGSCPSATPFSPSTPDYSRVPLLMVCLPELPADAEAEVELILASSRAASCLDVSTGSVAGSMIPLCGGNLPTAWCRETLWDTGHDHPTPQRGDIENGGVSSRVEITSVARYLGLGCACVSTVMATWVPGYSPPCTECPGAFDFDSEEILSKMVDSSIRSAKGKGDMGSLFSIGDVLSVRLYYQAASILQKRDATEDPPVGASSLGIELVDDGSMLRTQLHSVLQSKTKQHHRSNSKGGEEGTTDIPAYTVVPVLGMHLSAEKETPKAAEPIVAVQVLFANMIRTETEMWARQSPR